MENVGLDQAIRLGDLVPSAIDHHDLPVLGGTLLALLLENVGVDQAVRLGDPEVWRAAVRDLG